MIVPAELLTESDRVQIRNLPQGRNLWLEEGRVRVHRVLSETDWWVVVNHDEPFAKARFERVICIDTEKTFFEAIRAIVFARTWA